MKKMVVLPVVLALLASQAAAGTLTVKAVPESVPNGDPGQVMVEFWLDDFRDVTGIEVIPTFELNGVDVGSLFTIHWDSKEPLWYPWNGYAVSVNTALWDPSIPFVAGNMIGFVDAFNPGENIASETWIMAITYDYTQLAPGTYIIGPYSSERGIVDIWDGVPDLVCVPATFTVVPEPATIAMLGMALAGMIVRRRLR